MERCFPATIEWDVSTFGIILRFVEIRHLREPLPSPDSFNLDAILDQAPDFFEELLSSEESDDRDRSLRLRLRLPISALADPLLPDPELSLLSSESREKRLTP